MDPAPAIHVLVAGGGFGGLEAIRTLRKNRAFRGRSRITLASGDNFFLFTSLLPEVASGVIETRHIVYPLRSFASRHGVRFLMNRLVALDPAARRAHLRGGVSVAYDYLILALGAETNFYGVPGAAENSFTMRTLMDAIRLRAHVVERFELADQAEDPEVRQHLLTFVVAGGGVTGVEVASEMLRFARDTLLPRYPNLAAADLTVHLVEPERRLMVRVQKEHGEIAERHLRTLGVNLLFHRRVTAVADDRVTLDDGTVLPAHTVIWTAGIRGSEPEEGWPAGFPVGPNGKLRVEADGRVAGQERVYAIGDLALWPDAETAEPAPAIAQAAIQGGRVAARNLLAALGLGQPAPFRFRDWGYIVGLGKRSTVARLFGIRISGWLGWYVWAFIYLVKMVGFRKQLEVMTDHVKSFFFEPDISQIYDHGEVLRARDRLVRLGASRPGPDTEP